MVVINLDAEGEVARFVYNNYDRDVLRDLPATDVAFFYDSALPLLSTLIRSPAFHLKIKVRAHAQEEIHPQFSLWLVSPPLSLFP